MDVPPMCRECGADENDGHWPDCDRAKFKGIAPRRPDNHFALIDWADREARAGRSHATLALEPDEYDKLAAEVERMRMLSGIVALNAGRPIVWNGPPWGTMEIHRRDA